MAPGEVQLLRLCVASTFFYARQIYVGNHGKITWQWKSTFSLKLLNVDHSIVNVEECFLLNFDIFLTAFC